MPKKKGNIFEKDKKSEFEDEPEEFLEPDEQGSHEDAEFKIHVGNKEADVYTEEGQDELSEDAEIAPWEEGFSRGAELIEGGHCAHCHKPLGDREEDVYEKEYKGETLLFCSEKCASAGAVKKKKD